MMQAIAHILIVDDEEAICWGLRRLLEGEWYTVDVASSAEEGLNKAGRKAPQLIVLDIRLPGLDGLAAISEFQQRLGPVPIILITAFGTLKTAVSATQHGVVEYLTKPFDLDDALAAIRRALAGGPPAPLETDADPVTAGEEMIGAGPAMQEVFKLIGLVSRTDVSTFITGESGTGKELVARAIHRHSQRADKPFIPVHLASLSPSLIESELFGHVRGAFTGADSDRQGVLEAAHGATIFFDEAGDIPPQAQVKLLRVLEQRQLTPVGDSRPRACDFRVIVATNRDLNKQIATGEFRQDLFFRLAGFEIPLPPLRERREDIPLLADYFLRNARVPARETIRFSREAMEELCRRAWPGNVRELRTAVERGALMARGGAIGADHLPPPRPLEDQRPAGSLQQIVRDWAAAQLAATPDARDLHERFLAEAEPTLFHAVLDRVLQNRTAAAEILGINRATLRKRL